jgi:Las1-like
MPIEKLAGIIGIPGWIVTLRHEITHNKIQHCLDIVTKALEILLEIVKRNYWERQMELFEGGDVDNKAQDQEADYLKMIRILKTIDMIGNSQGRDAAAVYDRIFEEVSVLNEGIRRYGKYFRQELADTQARYPRNGLLHEIATKIQEVLETDPVDCSSSFIGFGKVLGRNSTILDFQ